MDPRTSQYHHDNPPPPLNPYYRAGFTVALTKFHAAWCDAHPDATREERAAAYQATATSLRRDFPTEAERQHKRQFSTHN